MSDRPYGGVNDTGRSQRSVLEDIARSLSGRPREPVPGRIGGEGVRRTEFRMPFDDQMTEFYSEMNDTLSPTYRMGSRPEEEEMLGVAMGREGGDLYEFFRENYDLGSGNYSMPSFTPGEEISRLHMKRLLEQAGFGLPQEPVGVMDRRY